MRGILVGLIFAAIVLPGGLPLRAAPQALPVKVFILAGQSNMEGQAVADLMGKDYNEGKATLRTLLGNPEKGALFRHLVDDTGEWAIRDDVWVRYQPENGPLKAGPLTLGFTPYGGKHHFGPELQFGHVLGSRLQNQVLLIKTAWGGKSLYRDFRPPSAGGEVGPYYRKMLTQVREALVNLKAEFPGYQGQGYELAGLVWYQGWNDGVDPRAVAEYEQNLVHLISDVRRDLQAPSLPVVVGELTGPWVDAPGDWAKLRRAQAAAADRPEVQPHVRFVPTHNFVRRPEESPNPTHGHHEFGNAETYFLVGDALAKGMLELLNARPKTQTRTVEGWTVIVSERLLQDEARATAVALELLAAQLKEIVRVVPAPAVEKLRQVKLWLSPEYPGVGPRAEYHPGVDWLVRNGRDPAMVKAVEFTNIRIFPAEVRRMPVFVLHELSHAYHDRWLGFRHPGIEAAYKQALANGTYDRVERQDAEGRKRLDRSYALASAQEYFAESTEAFFGRNDFYPYTRAELEKHDPEVAKLLRRLWGVERDVRTATGS